MATTNVPQEIRTIWTDLYKLFDIFYKMPNTEADWLRYWDAGKKIWEQAGKNDHVMEALTVMADVIGDRMKGEGTK